jgi:hypothetical protein
MKLAVLAQSIVVGHCSRRVIITRKSAIIMLQLTNIAVVLVFCVLYSSHYHDRGAGIMAWVESFVSLLLYLSLRYPLQLGHSTVTRNIIPALGIWSFSLFFLGIFLEDHLLLFTGIILIFSLLMLIFFYLRALSRKRLYSALVLRGEIEYLEDVEQYIQESCINNRVELIESGYTEERLRIVNESEWCSLTESEKERSFTQLKEEKPNHDQITFFCSLRGEYRYLGAIGSFVTDYLSDWKIQSYDVIFSLERLHVVRKD